MATEYQLELFVVGRSSKSQKAEHNLRRLCDARLAGRYELRVTDVPWKTPTPRRPPTSSRRLRWCDARRCPFAWWWAISPNKARWPMDWAWKPTTVSERNTSND